MFNTNYMFQIDNKNFKDFIPLLFDSIVNPLFNKENIVNEMNNVNSEVDMKITYNKDATMYKFLREFGNLESVLYRDAGGRFQVDKIDVDVLRQDLVDFHQKYYSANLIKICIVGSMSQNTLVQSLEHHFGKVENKQVPRPFYNETATYIEPFDEKFKNSIYLATAQYDLSTFSLIFKIPSQLKESYFSPVLFFWFLATFKAQNSLEQTLKSENLITKMWINTGNSDYINTIGIFNFLLSGKIDGKMDIILSYFYSFVAQLLEDENIETMFEIYSKISIKNYFFNSKNEFVDFNLSEDDQFEDAVDFSQKMFNFSNKEVLVVGAFASDFNKDKFREWLRIIIKENPIILIQSKEFQVANKNEENSEKAEQLNSLNKISQFKLDKTFKFDEEIQFTSFVKSDDFIANFQSNKGKKSFALIPIIDTQIFEHYSVETSCPIPNSIKTKSPNFKTVDEGLFSIRTPRTQVLGVLRFKNLMLAESASVEEQQTQIKLAEEIEQLKDCLTFEFKDDDQPKQVELIRSSNNLRVYHRLYRKTMQEEIAVVLHIESETLKSLVLANNIPDLRQFRLNSSVLCKYLVTVHQITFPGNHLEGNSVLCSADKTSLDFKFVGRLQSMRDFSAQFMKFIHEKAFSELFQPRLLQIIKDEMLFKYKQVKTYSISKFVNFYENLALMRDSVDFSKLHIYEQIETSFSELQKENLLSLKTSLFKDAKLTVLIIGAISKSKADSLSSHFESKLKVNYAVDEKSLNDLSYYDFARDNSLLKLKVNEHQIVQIPNPLKNDANSAYSSYFHFGISTRRKLFMNSVLQKGLHQYLFTELRVKRNYGYVASGYFFNLNDV